MTPRIQAALENGMWLWPTHSEEGRSIPGTEPIRRISALTSFNFILNYPDLHIWNSGFDGPCESECFRRRIRFVQFSIIRKHVMRDRVATNYIRKRLSIHNEKNWSQDRALGDPTSQKRRRGFYVIYSYYLCPIMQVRTEEGKARSQIPKAFSRRVRRMLWSTVLKAALRSTNVRMEREPESQAVRRSLKTRELYIKKESWLEGVPKIVLIKMTKKLVRNNFLNTVGHKWQIWKKPKVFKHISVKRGLFQKGLFNYDCFHTGRKNAGRQRLENEHSEPIEGDTVNT